MLKLVELGTLAKVQSEQLINSDICPEWWSTSLQEDC